MEQNINQQNEINDLKFSSVGPVKFPTRHFAGKTEFTLDYSTPETLAQSKAERHFYQRMLRAYLKGKTHFHFGFEYVPQRVPKLHKVDVDYK